MDSQIVLADLEDVARRLGLDVRYESLREGETDIGSGRCRLRGRDILFVDRTLAASARIQLLIRELNRMNLTGIYIKPYLRDLLQAQREEAPQGDGVSNPNRNE